MILAGDLNDDGKVDLAVLDSGGSAIHLFAGNGDGTFGRDVEVGAASAMVWMGSGHFQGQARGDFRIW
jgi:hypothetical protein